MRGAPSFVNFFDCEPHGGRLEQFDQGGEHPFQNIGFRREDIAFEFGKLHDRDTTVKNILTPRLLSRKVIP